jgi:hypothetical protein
MTREDRQRRAHKGWITRRYRQAELDANAALKFDKLQAERRAAAAKERTFEIWAVRREAGELLLECKDVGTRERVNLRFQLKDEGERQELADAVKDVLEYWQDDEGAEAK